MYTFGNECCIMMYFVRLAKKCFVFESSVRNLHAHDPDHILIPVPNLFELFTTLKLNCK